VAVRNIRADVMKKIKAAETGKEIWEDVAKNYETSLQKQIDKEIENIEDMLSKKEADIMKV
jgi:ribosome recycling factor